MYENALPTCMLSSSFSAEMLANLYEGTWNIALIDVNRKAR